MVLRLLRLGLFPRSQVSSRGPSWGTLHRNFLTIRAVGCFSLSPLFLYRMTRVLSIREAPTATFRRSPRHFWRHCGALARFSAFLCPHARFTALPRPPAKFSGLSRGFRRFCAARELFDAFTSDSAPPRGFRRFHGTFGVSASPARFSATPLRFSAPSSRFPALLEGFRRFGARAKFAASRSRYIRDASSEVFCDLRGF